MKTAAMKGSLMNFIRTRMFWMNVLAALLLGIGLVLLLMQWLSGFTRHGESIMVPDVQGTNIQKGGATLQSAGLDFKVVDSIYANGKSAGTIIDQDPDPKSFVKEGRTIYLIVNAINPPKVKMPNLEDVSYRQAEAILESFGLRVGRITYKSDIAKNAVLRQIYKGATIAPGKEVYKGSAIDLVLGDGQGLMEVPVPDLSGLTREEAILVLRGASLTLGNVTYDQDVQDSSEAKIYLQAPESGDNAVTNQGSRVNIFLH
jgi:beta-lactam-binding protein with PASTA domain